jgi:hypothetical protein
MHGAGTNNEHIASSNTSYSLMFGAPSQEFHVISRNPKTMDQRGRQKKRDQDVTFHEKVE